MTAKPHPRRASLGWKPDLPDFRDHTLTIARRVVRLAPVTDLRAKCPPVYDQGELGSCTANAIAAALDFERAKQGKPFLLPSRLFIYFNERTMEGTVDSDAGALIRDGIKSVGKQGACPESTWPYDPSKFSKKPPKPCYDAALHYQALSYMRVNRDLNAVMQCLAAGFPIVFGFTVYDSFMSETTAKTGVMQLPQRGESVQGGHAVLMVGYDQKSRRFIVRNSWGPDWGQKGYFTMPFGYITNPNLSDDFWTIRVVE
jgi:C1A family cysteine protease